MKQLEHYPWRDSQSATTLWVPFLYWTSISNSWSASDHRNNLALFGAHSRMYWNGLWSQKMDTRDPKIMSRKRLSAHMMAYASRSMVAYAICVSVSFWLAKANGCSTPFSSNSPRVVWQLVGWFILMFHVSWEVVAFFCTPFVCTVANGIAPLCRFHTFLW